MSICATSIGRCALVNDLFGRDASVYGLVTPDWEGYMANPAIEFLLSAPPGARLPVKLTLGCDDPRLYFDLPSTAEAQGPRKELTITGAEPIAVHVAIFPGRKKRDADRILGILMSDARGRSWRGRVTVHEVVVETHNRLPVYPIQVDFSQDKTGFYNDATHRATFQQAAADWAFYLADLHPQRVEPGAEKTWIFEPDGFVHSHLVTNSDAYVGTL